MPDTSPPESLPEEFRRLIRESRSLLFLLNYRETWDNKTWQDVDIGNAADEIRCLREQWQSRLPNCPWPLCHEIHSRDDAHLALNSLGRELNRLFGPAPEENREGIQGLLIEPGQSEVSGHAVDSGGVRGTGQIARPSAAISLPLGAGQELSVKESAIMSESKLHPWLAETLDLYSCHLPPKISAATGLALTCGFQSVALGLACQCMEPHWKEAIEKASQRSEETERLLIEAEPLVRALRPRLAKARMGRGPFRFSDWSFPDAHTAALDQIRFTLCAFDQLRRGGSPLPTQAGSLHFIKFSEFREIAAEICHEAGCLAAESEREDTKGGTAATATTTLPADPCTHGLLLLADYQRRGEKPTVARLAEQIGVKRQSLHENKAFAPLRDMANELFGLFEKKAKKGDWQGPLGTRSKDGDLDAVDVDEEPIEDKAVD